MTALHAASSNGHDEVVRVLLAAKATVNTAVLEIIVIDKCHLCLVILSGHMQECMVILIKRPVND